MIYDFGTCELDAAAGLLRCGGESCAVEPRVFDLLHLLLRRPGDVVSRDTLVAELWDGRIVSEAAIDACVAKARRAVGDDGRAQRVIRTLPRRGVQLVAPVTRRGEAVAGWPAPALGGPNRPSIAVLSFRPLDGEALSASLGEGLAEDVTIELSRAAELFVVARQSAARFDPATAEAGAVGEALCVRYLLSGSVRTADDQLRVTAHLVRCATGEEVWADRFDGSLGEVFGMQIEIARRVTGTVVGRIAAADIDAPVRHHPGDLAAYDLVLRGLKAMHGYTLEGLQAAQSAFRAASEREPGWARPLGLLALTEIYLPWYYRVDTDVASAAAPAERALALDGRDTKAHCALGIVRLMEHDHARARQHFETGLRINGNDDLLLIEFGRFLMYDERPAEGLVKVAEAMRLNPFHPNWYWNIHGRCLHTLGRHAEAIASFERVVNPPFWTLAYLAACHAVAGDPAQAAAARERLMALRPDFSRDQLVGVFPYRAEQTRTRLLEEFVAAGLP